MFLFNSVNYVFFIVMLIFSYCYIYVFLLLCTGLFKMIAGALTTCHTQHT